jgi:ankyrin repeat protein
MSEGGNRSQQLAAVMLEDELKKYCRSDSLSEGGLRELIARHGLTQNNQNRLSNYFSVFYEACNNERVTEGIIQLLLDYFPHTASDGPSLLHELLCCHKNPTFSFIQLIVDADPDSVRSVDGANCTPLHYLCGHVCVDEATALEILNLLIDKYPEAARHADDLGCLPIHDACQWRSGEFCQVLIDEAPDSVSIVDSEGCTPLHYLCKNRVRSGELCQILINTAPDSVRIVDSKGWAPLHHLCVSVSNHVDDDETMQVLNLLIDKYQEAAGHADNEGSLPIHLASQLRSGEFCQILINAAPDSVSIVDSEGCMPLHYLCENDQVDDTAATQVLKLLIDKYPEAIRHANNRGSLPIHLASRWRSSESVSVLVNAYPGSVSTPDVNGELPLHHACSSGSLATVEYLYQQYPDAINHATTSEIYRGHYPIHAAISATALEVVKFLLNCDPNQKLIQRQGESLLHCACDETYDNIEDEIQLTKVLFDAHPEAIENNEITSNIHQFHEQVQAFINSELVYARQANDHRLMMTPDDNGRLPLHTALQNNARLGSIKLLLNGNPSAIRTAESNLAMPLHIACQYHDSASVVQHLLSLDASVLDAVDRDGNTVLHYACRGAKHDTIALLVEKTSVSKRNAHDKLPIHLLWESNNVSDRESLEYTESIFRLIRADPEMINQ